MSTASAEGNRAVRAGFDIAAGVLLFFTMLMIISICCRSLSEPKMRKPIIILFYTFAFTNCSIFLSVVILREYRRFWPDSAEKYGIYPIIENLFIPETLALACTFSIDGITMLFLGLSIQYLQGKKSLQMVRCLKAASAFFALILITIVLYFSLKYNGHQEHHVVRMVVDASILVINICFLVFLSLQLRNLGSKITQAVSSV